MIDLTALTPYVVGFIVLGTVAAGGAVATLTRIAFAAGRTPGSRPVVMVTRERVTSGARSAA